MLKIANSFALLNSLFASKPQMDETVTSLPEENGQNTYLGYALYQSGRITAARSTEARRCASSSTTRHWMAFAMLIALMFVAIHNRSDRSGCTLAMIDGMPSATGSWTALVDEETCDDIEATRN